MNTAPRDACQTCLSLSLYQALGRAAASLLAGILSIVAGHVDAQPPAPSPPGTPPAWQQELDAARLLEASLLVAPAKDPAEAASRNERVARLYQGLADKYPDRAAVQKACGESAWRRGNAGDALPALRRAEALDPADADTADALAEVNVQLGRMKDATAQYRLAIRLSPNDPRYHFAFANVLYLFRHELIEPPALPDDRAVLTESLGEFRRAAELAPRDLGYAQAYAETFYTLPQPDWEQARTAWKAVLALSGANTDFANSHLARISLRLKRPEDVENYLSLIHDPAFAGLKASFHIQAAKLPPATP